MVHAIQYEWIFLQRLTKYMEQAFTGVGKVLWENFLPCLFFGISKIPPPVAGDLSMFPVKKSGLVIQNPVTSAAEKYTSSLRVSYRLISTVTY